MSEEAVSTVSGSVVEATRRAYATLLPREKRKYLALVTAKSLSGVLDVCGIVLVGFLASIAATGIGAGGSEPNKVLGIEVPQMDVSGIFIMTCIVLGIFVLKAVIAIIITRALASHVARIESRNASLIARRVLSGQLDELKQIPKADFQYAVTASTTYAFTGILYNVGTIITESVLLGVITVTFFLVDPLAAIFTVIYLGLVVVLIHLFIGRSLKRAGREAVAGTVDTMDLISGSIDTYREISVLHRRDYYIDRISAARDRISRSDSTVTFLAGMPRYVVETALILGVVLLIAQQFLSGQYATGFATVGIFLAGGVRMMASLLPLQSSLANIKQNSEKSDLSLTLLERGNPKHQTQVTSPKAQLEISGPFGVTLSKVGYRYPGSPESTLKSISLSISAGSSVAVIGPSGAGKTTLVDVILGLANPQSGQVEIAGFLPGEVRSMFPGSVAYVPQKPGLIAGSIAENVAIGIPSNEIDLARVKKVLADAYLLDLVDSLPYGIDSSVGAHGDALSGGQIQRLGLARALYTEPRLLVLDEATSGLDASSEASVAKSIIALRGKVTVIVIAHRLSTVQHADVVHVLEAGKIKASGEFKKLRKEVPMVAEYVRLMSFDD
ncbi:MAG: ABC transporter ATP-binding protein [Cryobacterium sp.]|nr:ABC transporter ATP-binding protein [Cryobacterium sp.]MCO5294627.1 ABC transporter ATP-binding protein/permease [Homoserinimonas sp.]